MFWSTRYFQAAIFTSSTATAAAVWMVVIQWQPICFRHATQSTPGKKYYITKGVASRGRARAETVFTGAAAPACPGLAPSLLIVIHRERLPTNKLPPNDRRKESGVLLYTYLIRLLLLNYLTLLKNLEGRPSKWSPDTFCQLFYTFWWKWDTFENVTFLKKKLQGVDP